MNYYYVFIAPDENHLNIIFSDLNSAAYSRYIGHRPKINNPMLDFLYRAHTSVKLNRTVNLPFKNIWKRHIQYLPSKTAINKNDPVCFIVYSRYFDYLGRIKNGGKSFIDYLRSNYENCRIILYFGDLLKTFSFDINEYRNCFDLILSYDKNEAAKNSFLYHEFPFSLHQASQNLSLPSSDVTFIGRGKDRLKEIFTIFEILQNNNFVCDFIIADVPKKEQMFRDKIIYSRLLSYPEILEHVASSKCILEVLQDGASSPTVRVSEAICYSKKLISNCPELKAMPYYNPDYISVFSDPKYIDLDFIRKDAGTINYNYKNRLSPLKMIGFIDEYLQKGIKP
jgi:hypothetical protein